MQIDDRFIHRLLIAATIIYTTLVTVFCIIYHLFPGQEFIIVFVSLYAISRKWSQRFIRDWVPFIILFIGYESMYGFADNILGVVHINELINLETRLFGTIPTLVLQQFYRNIILDYLCTFLYSLHFILPVAFGFILWRYSKNFQSFTAAFLICSYGALITFLLFPSAPPWYGVNAIRIYDQTIINLGSSRAQTIFDYADANKFAAFPSLHSAYPWLIFLYAAKIKGMKALPIIILPISIWFSTVYLGEHYVVDVIGGIIYSTCSFLIIEKLLTRLPFSFPLISRNQVNRKILPPRMLPARIDRNPSSER